MHKMRGWWGAVSQNTSALIPIILIRFDPLRQGIKQTPRKDFIDALETPLRLRIRLPLSLLKMTL